MDPQVVPLDSSNKKVINLNDVDGLNKWIASKTKSKKISNPRPPPSEPKKLAGMSISQRRQNHQPSRWRASSNTKSRSDKYESKYGG